MAVKYLAKNFLYVALSGFASCGTLRRYREQNYRYDRDKPDVLRKHHSLGPWRAPAGGMARRDYGNYDEYLQHQAAKYDVMLRSEGGVGPRAIVAYRMRFYRRFRHLRHHLHRDARMLCLGARQGTEVEVLRDLGFRRALGIDLNPGPRNRYVLPGDFMNAGFKDQSFDFLYSNAVDHAFDLDQFFREAARILRPDGFAMWDIAGQADVTFRRAGYCAFEALRWDREELVVGPMLCHFKRIVRAESEPGWKWFLVQGTSAARG